MSPKPQRRCDCNRGDAVQLFDARDYVSGDPFTIVQCSSCGLAFTDPAPEADQWQRYYPASYYGKANANRFPIIVEWLQNRLYAARASKVELLSGGKPGRVLDIGCGRGHLLRAFQRRGWEIFGTEMSEASAAFAQSHLKIPVHVGDLREFDSAKPFDAIVMWHVLEHFARAVGALRDVHRLLRPGGVLLVAVPNLGSLEARLARDKWFHLDVPRHLTHFSRSALTQALEACGFRVETMSHRSLEYDFFSAAQSFLSRVGLQHNWLYNVLRGGGDRTMPQLLGHFLGAPAAALFGTTAFLAGGSTVVVYARKT